MRNPSSCVVAIQAVDGRIVGTGFLAAKDRIVTAAGVVEAAGSGPGKPLSFRLATGTHVYEGVVWEPGWYEDQGIAVVAFDHDLPDNVAPVVLGNADGLDRYEFSTFGFPDLGGTFQGLPLVGEILPGMSQDAAGVPQLVLKAEVRPGFAGAPVLVEVEQQTYAVGMITAHIRPAYSKAPEDTAFAIPSTELATALEAGMEGDVPVIPLQELLSPSSPATYLFTWNPARFPFSEFKDAAQKVQQQGETTLGWSTGNRTHVSLGDRVFLMRQGQEPRGVVGSGRIAGDVTTEPHWDEAERAKGKTYHRALVRWDMLGESPLLTLANLVDQTGEEKLWNTAAGGVEIPRRVANLLEALWDDARPSPAPVTPPPPTPPTPVTDPQAWVQTDAVPNMGALRDDYKPSKYDSLDAEAQAKIFATLLVSKHVQPPFALGLLGDWGVGKTFFMRLMQEAVTSMAGKDATVGHSSGSVLRAAQIEFNAWHYVDSHLWASLASHIFDSLSRELAPDDKVGKTRRELRQKIWSSKREQEEAEAAKAAAEKEREKAAQALEAKQTERARDQAAYESHRLKRVWEAVLRIKPDDERKELPDIEALREKAEETAVGLGVTNAINSAQEVERVLAEMRALWRRGAGLSAALAASFTGGRALLSAGVLLLLLALVIAWPWFMQFIETAFALPSESLTRLVAPLLQLGTVAGSAAGWASKQLNAISSAIGYLEQIQEELAQSHIKPEDASQEEKDLKEKIDGFDKEIANQQRLIKQADQRISQAEMDIQRINAGGLVYDFLEGRVRDSRYLDRLGLISVIRQDFDRLGTLLKEWGENGDSDDRQTAGDAREKQPIERIILYIDDLDRCPPKRVVQVLQAIHLILAFKLFAVVVAVDPRWLERSLNEEYNPSVVERDGYQADAEPAHRFSAHNYLEKIFQIPFSLPKMNESGYQKLVASMLDRPRQQEEEERQRRARELAEAERQRKEQDAPDREEVPGPVVAVEPDDPEALMKPSSIEGETEDEAEQRRKEEEAEQRRQEQEEQRRKEAEEQQRKEEEETNKRLEAMELREREKLVISGLYAFIETPRLAKRFVNIYRLLRVRAATREEGFSPFIDRDQGAYRAVLVLLAICVGHADVAAELLDDLHTAKGDRFSEWLQEIAKHYGAERARLRDERLAQPGATSSPSEREERLEELQKASQKIYDEINEVRQVLEELKGPLFDDKLASYSSWAREVGRYSFHWHLKAED